MFPILNIPTWIRSCYKSLKMYENMLKINGQPQNTKTTNLSGHCFLKKTRRYFILNIPHKYNQMSQRKILAHNNHCSRTRTTEAPKGLSNIFQYTTTLMHHYLSISFHFPCTITTLHHNDDITLYNFGLNLWYVFWAMLCSNIKKFV